MNQVIKNDKCKKSPWWLCFAIIICYSFLYSLINSLPLHRKILPFILNESSIPFLPFTLIFYLSSFVQSIFVLRVLPMVILKRVMDVSILFIFIFFILYILYPVKYPREIYASNIYYYRLFYLIDKEGNCFPSLHVFVAIVFAYFYVFITRSIIKKILMWIWCFVITISVLTTKQHYMIDVFGGIALALLYFKIINPRIRNITLDTSSF